MAFPVVAKSDQSKLAVTRTSVRLLSQHATIFGSKDVFFSELFWFVPSSSSVPLHSKRLFFSFLCVLNYPLSSDSFFCVSACCCCSVLWPLSPLNFPPCSFAFLPFFSPPSLFSSLFFRFTCRFMLLLLMKPNFQLHR